MFSAGASIRAAAAETSSAFLARLSAMNDSPVLPGISAVHCRATERFSDAPGTGLNCSSGANNPETMGP